MKQITCNLSSGIVSLDNVPAPRVEYGHLLIRTVTSLVSKGTERSLVEFGKMNILQKARSQPARVQQVISKIRTNGLFATAAAVFNKLDEPIPLGYCQAGIIVEVGDGVSGFSVGDRVVSNGPHSEFVCVPQNLVAKIPADLPYDEAVFGVISAISLQGIRLSKPELGEVFVVIGLGLLGQITSQLLISHGCRVIGFDFDSEKVSLAKTFGVDAVCIADSFDLVGYVYNRTNAVGADGVIITASSKSSSIIKEGAQMSRKRGRIILIGVIGLDINRSDFYSKELTFQVSCSYGPGRYDNNYEDKGVDYPIAYVRWTENRNIQAVLEAMSLKRLQVAPLVSRRIPIEDFLEVYDSQNNSELAVLFTYGNTGSSICRNIPISVNRNKVNYSKGAIAVIGSGNFSKMTLFPALSACNAPVKTLVSTNGVTAAYLARKYNVQFCSSDLTDVIRDSSVSAVIVATRHNSHAANILSCIAAGKSVLVEKPLCICPAELYDINRALEENSDVSVSVGYNRRFSPHIIKIRELTNYSAAPISFVATVNAGMVPADHWVNDPVVGGGRVIGEACHFVDLAVFVTGSLIEAVCSCPAGGIRDSVTNSASILLRHKNGSNSTINYLINGHRSYSKERVEVYSDGRILILDDFRVTTGFGFKNFRVFKSSTDKGHGNQFREFVSRLHSGGGALIPWNEVYNVTRAVFAIGESFRAGTWISI